MQVSCPVIFRWQPRQQPMQTTSTMVIVRRLIGHVSERQDNLLEEFFYLPSEEAGTAPETKNEGNKRTQVKPPIVNSKPKKFTVQKVRGGFKIVAAADVVPKSIQIKVAYEVLKGDPFKKYDPLDFVFQKRPIVITAKNGKYTVPKPNEILFTPSAKRYQITVKGFDQNRDLVISAK